jgi:alkanesulfonate monooxygenase SsuD/methylene tetrahydromethanopterin reductase-like flavin-dependent oxidoreductase (luciferase family)
MGRFEIGVVLPLMQYGPDRVTSRWTDIRALAIRAEKIGFDTIWTPDELLWIYPDRAAHGVWDGVSMAGGIAAATSTATVGTWVMSALHRNPGIIAKTAETLDEISGGRFLFGLGAGHVWPGQAHAFGLPEDRVFDRFEEALQIIVPLLRKGRADFTGTWHAAHDLSHLPVGPRPNAIPILIGGNGPRGQTAAARHADIYSCYIEEHAHADEAAPRLASLDAICETIGRDPATIGRSVGMYVDATAPAATIRSRLTGSAEEIADTVRSFRDAGFSRVELMLDPGTMAGLDALEPVVAMLHADDADPGRSGG